MRQKIQSSTNIVMMMIPFRVKFHGIKVVRSACSTSKTGKTAPDIEVTSKVVPKSTTKYPKQNMNQQQLVLCFHLDKSTEIWIILAAAGMRRSAWN